MERRGRESLPRPEPDWPDSAWTCYKCKREFEFYPGGGEAPVGIQTEDQIRVDKNTGERYIWTVEVGELCADCMKGYGGPVPKQVTEDES